QDQIGVALGHAPDDGRTIIAASGRCHAGDREIVDPIAGRQEILILSAAGDDDGHAVQRHILDDAVHRTQQAVAKSRPDLVELEVSHAQPPRPHAPGSRKLAGAISATIVFDTSHGNPSPLAPNLPENARTFVNVTLPGGSAEPAAT